MTGAHPDSGDGHPRAAGDPLEDLGEALVSDAELVAALEAVLLVVDAPAPTDQLADVLGEPVARVRDALEGLAAEYTERGRGMEFQRLKDKLGTRSLPSSEVEFRGALGRLVGEEGRGVPAIIRMVNHTRLDCLLGATTGLRRGTLEAIHHARHRRAFGGLRED